MWWQNRQSRHRNRAEKRGSSRQIDATRERRDRAVSPVRFGRAPLRCVRTERDSNHNDGGFRHHSDSILPPEGRRARRPANSFYNIARHRRGDDTRRPACHPTQAPSEGPPRQVTSAQAAKWHWPHQRRDTHRDERKREQSWDRVRWRAQNICEPVRSRARRNYATDVAPSDRADTPRRWWSVVMEWRDVTRR